MTTPNDPRSAAPSEATPGATGDALDPREVQLMEALERVQARVAAGTTLDAAMSDVPGDLREDLEATLTMLDRVQTQAAEPAPAFAAALEARLLTAVDEARRDQASARARTRWFRLGLMRFAAVLGAVVLALGGGGFAAVQAAEATIPGDALYPVKEAGETVRLLFARGDGVTRLRVAQLLRRQTELEEAVRRGAPPRIVLRLEAKVAVSTSELVQVARRFDAAGNQGPAETSRVAVIGLHDRIDVLVADEPRPEVARLLRRMALFLEGREAELEAITVNRERTAPTPQPTPSPPPARSPATAAPGSAVPSSGAVPAPTGTSTRAPGAETTVVSDGRSSLPSAEPTREAADPTITPTATPLGTRSASVTPTTAPTRTATARPEATTTAGTR